MTQFCLSPVVECDGGTWTHHCTSGDSLIVLIRSISAFDSGSLAWHLLNLFFVFVLMVVINVIIDIVIDVMVVVVVFVVVNIIIFDMLLS